MMKNMMKNDNDHNEVWLGMMMIMMIMKMMIMMMMMIKSPLYGKIEGKKMKFFGLL